MALPVLLERTREQAQERRLLHALVVAPDRQANQPENPELIVSVGGPLLFAFHVCRA
jgi:hypothetical protein